MKYKLKTGRIILFISFIFLVAYGIRFAIVLNKKMNEKTDSVTVNMKVRTENFDNEVKDVKDSPPK